MSRLLDKVPGIGKLIASVIAASVPTERFKSGRDFRRLSRPHAETKLERRQADARRHNQAGQPIHKEDAGLGGDLAAQRPG